MPVSLLHTWLKGTADLPGTWKLQQMSHKLERRVQLHDLMLYGRTELWVANLVS